MSVANKIWYALFDMIYTWRGICRTRQICILSFRYKDFSIEDYFFLISSKKFYRKLSSRCCLFIYYIFYILYISSCTTVATERTVLIAIEFVEKFSYLLYILKVNFSCYVRLARKRCVIKLSKILACVCC